MLFTTLAFLSLLTTSFGVPSLAPSAPEHCSSFTQLTPKLSGISIQNVTYISEGGFTTPSGMGNGTTSNKVSFCRVTGVIPYGSNDTLVFEVWLPDFEKYNGRFLAVGNGGFAGEIEYSSMVEELGKGFAVASGNSGHAAALNNGGIGAPGVYLPFLHDRDQVLSWIQNSIAMLTSPSRELVANYYNDRPRYSYYWGCSTGGAQGFALAQFHPELFDGIFAGSPGNWYTHLALSFLWNYQVTNYGKNNNTFLPQETLKFITSAVLDKCDTIDGVADRLIEDPLRCSFDIKSLACNSSQANDTRCLTSAQLAVVEAIYAGPKDVRTGSPVYPGFSFGSEIEWLDQEGDTAEAFSIPLLQNLVYNNLSWDPDAFNWGSDIDYVNLKAGPLIDEISPDLSAFKEKGGRLLVSQGWADQLNAAMWPIEHMLHMQASFGGDISDWFNLFMVPGGGHCGSAPNYLAVPGTYWTLEALVEWTEHGNKPTSILSTDPLDGSNRTRKLCPWPQTAKFVGEDQNDWTSYTCD